MTEAAYDIWVERAIEIEKVHGSFAYFLDEFALIEEKRDDGQGGRAIPFKLWPEQRRILPMLLTALLLMILKARQLGLTWLCAAYALWLCTMRPLQLVVVISAKEEWAIEFLDRVKFILQRLPEWMYPEKSKETSQELRFRHEDGTESIIKSLATTEEGAQSKTPTLLILDETARNRMIRSIYGSSKPGIDAAGGRIIVISNSIKDGVGWSWTRDICTNAMKKLNSFVLLFMSWTAHPGRPANFRELQLQGGMDEDQISDHYPETLTEAISTALGSYFGKTLVRHSSPLPGHMGMIRKDQEGEIGFHVQQRGILEIWRYPYNLVAGWDGLFWDKRYAMGSDVSEGLGQTFSVAYIQDRLTDEFIARLRSNRVDAHQWGDMLWLLCQYYHMPLICIERTGAGQTTVKRLSKLNAPQYRRVIPGKVGGGMQAELGWHESQQAKHELLGDLKTYFRNTKGQVFDGILIDESATYIRHDTGKLDPEEGKLGDCVIAAGCTIQASLQMGEPPKIIKPADTGWMKRWKEGGKSAWTQ